MHHLATALALAVILAITACQVPLRSQALSADDWFRLVVELQGQASALDRDERIFVNNMINVLALSEDRMPKPHQQQWLLNIRARLQPRQP